MCSLPAEVKEKLSLWNVQNFSLHKSLHMCVTVCVVENAPIGHYQAVEAYNIYTVYGYEHLEYVMLQAFYFFPH